MSIVRRAIICCILLLLSLSTPAQRNVKSKRRSFRQYPAAIDFTGKPARPLLDTPLEHAYRTQIRTQASEGPSFAGHFTIARLGCGVPCVKFVIIDARSGIVYDPGLTVGCSDKNGGGTRVEFKLTSRLIITTGFSDKFGCGTDFYEWNRKQLILLHYEPPPDSGT